MTRRDDPSSGCGEPVERRKLRPGDILFEEGEPSDYVVVIRRGEVIVGKVLAGERVEIGRIREGEVVGEMGVIQGRERTATIVADKETEVDLFDLESFLSRVSADRDLAFQTLRRLCERLSAADHRIAALLEEMSDTPRRPAALVAVEAGRGKRSGVRTRMSIRICSASDRTSIEIPEEGLVVSAFPFAVGRRIDNGEPRPSVDVDLAINDTKPYRLSRIHFTILETEEGYVISDTTSTLGTRVNDHYVGENFPSVRAPLQRGDNIVIAGGEKSDFAFRIVVDSSSS